ncbi:ABC transporter C member 13 [Coemansia aciculifera]|uniref:ABC transporter C member 13 n=1 Tax=Coemansia aciculifera TaxID=417176 RepID=A0A9W8IRD9_9FUNG|nr:ABC transporter C member 13 [Coemansia aciculifera]
MANLDSTNKALLNRALQLCTYAQVRYLVRIQKLRQLTIGDIWPLQERFQLRNSYSEFRYNTNESYFIIRAIIRMIWRPMVPIYIIGLLLQFVPIVQARLNSLIMKHVESSTEYSFYMIIADDNQYVEDCFINQYVYSLPYSEEASSDGPLVELSHCSFDWGNGDYDYHAHAYTLFDVTLNARGGELVAVIGKTGAGKSSLLLAMCSEMEMTQGTGRLVGKIAYLEQQPWIMNDTLRANILFGREYDEDYYWKVLTACALTDDLEVWPNSDLTIIGENGINISGGQRARLALARTVYSRADIYFLDDPLSAVDAIVKRHILDNIILSTGLLGNKLRFVTTHADNILPLCNQIATVDNGSVSVKVQTPQVHTAFKFNGTLEVKPEISDSTSQIPHAGISTDTTKSEKTARQWSHWDNAMYAIRICGWSVIATTLLASLFSRVMQYIFTGYKLDALRANSKSDNVSGSAVLMYMRMKMMSNISYSLVSQLQLVAKAAVRTSGNVYRRMQSLVNNGAQMIRLFGVEPYFTSQYIKCTEDETRLEAIESSSEDYSHILQLLIGQATKIEFRDFSMKYGADLGYALKNIDLTINPGEKIGIVGRTGAGKSSLAKVLFRLIHENTSGSILIDGQDISEFGVGDYRARLGMIPQESSMFDGSIRRNLDPLHQFNIEEMWASLIKCNMAELVAPKGKSRAACNNKHKGCTTNNGDSMTLARMHWQNTRWLTRLLVSIFDRVPNSRDPAQISEPYGLDKSVSGCFGSFSSGQQQLFGLCRVIMRRRRIIVLDEATANVDLETDKSVQELIRKEFSGCTVLTIAHRLETIMNSDRIVVMDKGTVAEIGTPQELLAKDGMFAQLVKTSDFGQ